MIAFGAACAGPASLPSSRQAWFSIFQLTGGSLPIENASIFYRNVLIRAGIVNLSIGALFVFLSRARGRARAALALAIAGVTAVELCASSRDFIQTRSVEWFRTLPPIVRRLQDLTPVPRLVDLLPKSPPAPVSGSEERGGPWERNRLYGKQAVGWGIPLALDEDYDIMYIAASVRARNLLLAVSAANMRNFSRLLAARVRRRAPDLEYACSRWRIRFPSREYRESGRRWMT